MAMADVREVYSHGGNTSTYAALFSMGLGVGKPEELAIAGILHDVGLVDVPAEIQEKPETDWTAVEKETYQKHPEFTVNILKKRKMILPDRVLEIIAQHHEAFADYFDYLISINSGKPLMSPREVLDFISEFQTL